MKRIIALLLVVLISVTLCACSNDSDKQSNESSDKQVQVNESKATIETNEGETVTMSAEELISEYDANEAKFDKLYYGAKIKFNGTVANIKTKTEVIVEQNQVTTEQNKIVFEEGWCLVLGADNSNYDLANYDVGDVLEVTTSIVGAPYDTDYLKTVSDNNRVVWLVGNDKVNGRTYSDIETVIETVK